MSYTNYRDQVSALEKLHAKHVLPGFADRSAEEKEIETATVDITRVCVLDPLLPLVRAVNTCSRESGISTVSHSDTAHRLGPGPYISAFK